MILDNIYSGKICLVLLRYLILNPPYKVFLIGPERDLVASSNTIDLSNELHLIKPLKISELTKVKYYLLNHGCPMFNTLRGFIMQFVVLDQIINKIRNLEKVYLTRDLVERSDLPFVDLVLVWEFDKSCLYQLI